MQLRTRRDILKFAAITAAAPGALTMKPSRLHADGHERRLGRDGPLVSAVGLGCNNFGRRLDYAGTEKVVHASVDHGITLFDTADVYSAGVSEEWLGKALGSRRGEVLIATKFGGPMGVGPKPDGGGSRENIMYAAEESLRRLNTDVIDLYQYHRPDNETPLEETLRAMDDLLQQGKVRYIGHSNFDAAQARQSARISGESDLANCVSAQNHYSLLTRDIEEELAPACEELGVSILPYFPLESGALTGKYKRGEGYPEGSRLEGFAAQSPAFAERFLNEERFDKIERLTALAESVDATLLDFAFGWLLSRPYIASVIAGATKISHIESNVKAAEWRSTPDVDREIDRITQST